ncbi:cytochrome P450 4C1-like [Centruroides sculpturatus]|uniref:cytochrome P450 4C1-like n=1 Tax=Centruroides sculpturatus TaxID=218467 RepID=UPI000C6D41E8|nr:cytochrome P450 4C1-like [Centruroides sculpturatus]
MAVILLILIEMEFKQLSKELALVRRNDGNTYSKLKDVMIRHESLWKFVNQFNTKFSHLSMITYFAMTSTTSFLFYMFLHTDAADIIRVGFLIMLIFFTFTCIITACQLCCFAFTMQNAFQDIRQFAVCGLRIEKKLKVIGSVYIYSEKTIFGFQKSLHIEEFPVIDKIYEFVNKMSWKRTVNVFLRSNLIFDYFSNGKKLKEYCNVLKEISEKILLKNLRSTEDNRDVKYDDLDNESTTFIDILSRNLKLKKYIPDEVHQNFSALTSAAYTTLSKTICWCLYEVGKNPEILAKIQDELDSILEDVNSPIRKEELQKMEYLECVINETMRMYPAVPITARLSEEEISVGNQIFPSNCNFLISIYHLQRNSRYFPNPNKFDPLRFLPSNSANRHPYCFIPFSAGRRNCIGNRYGMLVMKIFLAIVFRHLNVESIGKVKPKIMGIALESNVPFRFRIKSRC